MGVTGNPAGNNQPAREAGAVTFSPGFLSAPAWHCVPLARQGRRLRSFQSLRPVTGASLHAFVSLGGKPSFCLPANRWSTGAGEGSPVGGVSVGNRKEKHWSGRIDEWGIQWVYSSSDSSSDSDCFQRPALPTAFWLPLGAPILISSKPSKRRMAVPSFTFFPSRRSARARTSAISVSLS